jgi:hypothetical protein
MDFVFFLEKIATLQNLAIASDIHDVIRIMREPLSHYAELELRSDGTKIDLITLSAEQHIPTFFLELLRKRGKNEMQLNSCIDLLRFGEKKVKGMKLPIAGSLTEGEVYVRGAIALDEVIPYLKNCNVESDTITNVLDLAHIFNKKHTHMLASDAAYPPYITVFFTSYLRKGEEKEDQHLLEKALNILSLSNESICNFLSLHQLLGVSRPETLYFSWCIADGKPALKAKVDYANVRLDLLSKAFFTVNPNAKTNLPNLWGEMFGMNKANYAGVVIGDKGPESIRAYFTKHL